MLEVKRLAKGQQNERVQPRKEFREKAFFFNDTATTEIYTLSLHDALPISRPKPRTATTRRPKKAPRTVYPPRRRESRDRKSTRLNSSHMSISYAVCCLKKKKKVMFASLHNKKKNKKY